MSLAQRLGRLLALIALSVQLAATGLVLPMRLVEAAAVDRMVAVSICRGDHMPDRAPQQPQHPVCPVVLLCHALAHTGAVLTPAPPVLAAPVAAMAPPAPPPPARAPPAWRSAARFPRGPPRTA